MKNFNPRTAALTTSITTIAMVNETRKYLLLYNQGVGTAYIDLDASGAEIPIPSGKGVVWDGECPSEAITARSSSTSTLTIWER